MSIAKTAFEKIGALINVKVLKFFLLRLLCISINLPDSLPWNTIVMSGLVVLADTEMLDKLQKLICKTLGLSFAASLELLDHH